MLDLFIYGIIILGKGIRLEVNFLFQIGDKVVYPMHGAGIIEAIEEKEILGEKQPFLAYAQLLICLQWKIYCLVFMTANQNHPSHGTKGTA